MISQFESIFGLVILMAARHYVVRIVHFQSPNLIEGLELTEIKKTRTASFAWDLIDYLAIAGKILRWNFEWMNF